MLKPLSAVVVFAIKRTKPYSVSPSMTMALDHDSAKGIVQRYC